jgi:hypothetical protein
MQITATLVTSLFLVANVHAATSVGEYISSDTTWTLSNSSYRLTGTAIENPGEMLTIEPGVTILLLLDFDNAMLKIWV